MVTIKMIRFILSWVVMLVRLRSVTSNSEPTPSPISVRGAALSTTQLPFSIDVEIMCVDENGSDCQVIQPSDPQCSKETTVDNLQLQYTGGSCIQSRHTQGPHSSTREYQRGAIESSDAQVLCQASGITVIDETMKVGDYTTVDSDLRGKMSCTVSAGGVLMQEFLIDVTGSVDLFVEDVFCSLKVVGCLGSTCIQEVTYNYKLSNTGVVDAQLTSVERIRDTALTRSLTTQVTLKHGSNILEGGGKSVVVSETGVMNSCAETKTTLVVTADSGRDSRSITESKLLDILP